MGASYLRKGDFPDRKRRVIPIMRLDQWAYLDVGLYAASFGRLYWAFRELFSSLYWVAASRNSDKVPKYAPTPRWCEIGFYRSLL